MEDFAKTINNRIFSNPIYFIFGLSWFLVHWRFFATMFLVSNDSIFSTYGITKDIYLKHILFDINHLWISSLVVTIPFIVTWFVLYKLQPRFLVMLFEKHKDYEVKKEKVEIQAERELAEERTKKVNAEVKEVEAKTKIIKAEAKSIQADPTIGWEKEFQDFATSGLYYNFSLIVKAIYENNGNVNNLDGWNNVTSRLVPEKILSYAHSNDLVDFVDQSNDKIKLTQKGKYFTKRFQEKQAH